MSPTHPRGPATVVAPLELDLPAVRRAVEQWDRPHQLMVMPADHELALLAVD